MTSKVRTNPAAATFLGLHDGDTVRMLIDVDFEHAAFPWLRLRRVFAPELAQLGGRDCETFVAAWFARQAELAGDERWPLEVDTYKAPSGDQRRTLARYVAEVRGVGGESLNDAVIAFVAAHPEWPRGTGS